LVEKGGSRGVTQSTASVVWKEVFHRRVGGDPFAEQRDGGREIGATPPTE
jgi:hypothetical protein